MNHTNPCGISFINNPKNNYSNKLIKMSTKCISHNICNAENTINNSYKYLTIVHEYLQKIKEELDGLFKSNIPYSKLQSVLKIMNVYVKEIDYTISEAIYDDKNLIVSPNDEIKEIQFLFALPYNYEQHYPIGVPLASSANNYIFKYTCPIIDSVVLGLDIVLSDILIKRKIIKIDSNTVPDKGTLLKCENGIGFLVDSDKEEDVDIDNLWTIDVFYNHDSFTSNNEISNIDKTITYGNINSIENCEDIEDLENYQYISNIVCYLQYITDIAVNNVWNDIDKISNYLFLCEINSKLLRTFKIHN